MANNLQQIIQNRVNDEQAYLQAEKSRLPMRENIGLPVSQPKCNARIVLN